MKYWGSKARTKGRPAYAPGLPAFSRLNQGIKAGAQFSTKYNLHSGIAKCTTYGPCLPFEPHNHSRISSLPKTAVSPSGQQRRSPLYAAFDGSFSRIYSPLLQFRAYPSRVSLRLHTGASPVFRLQPPQADKQAAECTAPPPALHFRISSGIQCSQVAVWRRHILSLPLAAGLPPLKRQNRMGLLSPLHYVTLRSQTHPSTAQRGRDIPRP
jgi:hypothetical protein